MTAKIEKKNFSEDSKSQVVIFMMQLGIFSLFLRCKNLTLKSYGYE